MGNTHLDLPSHGKPSDCPRSVEVVGRFVRGITRIRLVMLAVLRALLRPFSPSLHALSGHSCGVGLGRFPRSLSMQLRRPCERSTCIQSESETKKAKSAALRSYPLRDRGGMHETWLLLVVYDDNICMVSDLNSSRKLLLNLPDTQLCKLACSLRGDAAPVG